MAQDAEARQLREIAEALHKARQWDDLFAGPSDWTQVIPGSDLSGDDRATSPYQVSQAACNFMLAAVSHLQGLREILGVPKDPGRLRDAAAHARRVHTRQRCLGEYQRGGLAAGI
jgi:hypothetical protein